MLIINRDVTALMLETATTSTMWMDLSDPQALNLPNAISFHGTKMASLMANAEVLIYEAT